MHPSSFFVVMTPLILQSIIPSQLHTTLTDTPGEIQFIWSTPSDISTPSVRISSNSIWQYFEGESSLFEDSSNIWRIHKVKAPLVPGLKYSYQVGSLSEGFSESFELSVPPSDNKSKVLIFGDISTRANGFKSWTSIKKSFKDLEIDAMVMLGDLSYDLHSDSSTRGDEFLDEIQEVASQIPLMTVAGNREKQDDYYNYLNRFPMPNNGFFYTFYIGLVKYVAIHTEAFIDEAEKIQEMTEFLKKALKRTDSEKEKYPWLVVIGHRPVYCLEKSKGCGKEAKVLKESLEDLFFLNEVDLYINGHLHNYQRTSPVFKDKVLGWFIDHFEGYYRPLGTIYITNGAIGSNGVNNFPGEYRKSEFIDFASSEYSFGVFTAWNQTHLQWEQYDSEAKIKIDNFWVIKRYSWGEFNN